MTWSPKWLHRHKCSKWHAWIIWNTLKSHKRTCSIMQCQEKFLWSPKMETGPPTLPIEWRIKPGESSGSGGSDVRGNISAKGIGWGKNHEGEKRTIYNWGTQIGQFLSQRLEWYTGARFLSLQNHAKGLCPYSKRNKMTLKIFEHMIDLHECTGEWK